MNNRQTGNAYEQMAAEYLQKKGMIREQKMLYAAIQQFLEKGKYLVFVEVKYRSGTAKGNAAEAVTISKQRKICSVADYYRCLHNYNDNTWVRYDVVAIQGEKIQWIPNAFPHYYRTRG